METTALEIEIGMTAWWITWAQIQIAMEARSIWLVLSICMAVWHWIDGVAILIGI